MTYRIDTAGLPPTLRFHGRLDELALGEIRRRAAASTEPIHLLLCRGVEVDSACLTQLLALAGLRVSAESPWLDLVLSEERR